ncbi:Uncharacterised protein [Vibrio cholerae]|nr:Uncharacterised protein [Vibrio cholerae]
MSAVRWTNVPSVLAALKQSRVRKRNVVNTEPTVLRKANCPCALLSVLPKHC